MTVRKRAKPETTPAADWVSALPVIDVSSLKSIFGPSQAVEADPTLCIASDRRHERRADRRVMLDARQLADAMAHIGRLPQEGEEFHLVTAKKYSLWHIVKAVLEMAKPAVISHLTVATLGFSTANLSELLALLDTGKIGGVSFLYSVFFKSLEKENCQRLTAELTRRGQRVCAALSHAKLLLLLLSDDRAFVCHSSSNIRSCSSIEQHCFCADRPLYDFHAGWISELMAEREKK